ncbi:MAG: HlyD family efflux transporter periplasmic adaptor subunit [Magnetococcales bacterium]|nr:HlyD family efflux transporter periplasmic adaptor subunit [Magnetococcales bacterium]
MDATHPLGMISFILMLIATAASLFMNLNPLMKFDGYYILSDVLQVPNLRENAISWFSYLLKVKVFRMEEEAPLRPTRREARIYFTYGGLTVVYLTIMLGGMAIMMHDVVAEALGTWGVIAYLAVVAKFTHMMTGSWADSMKTWIKETVLGTKERKMVVGVLLAIFVVSLFVWNPRVTVTTDGTVEADVKEMHLTEAGFVDYIGYRNDRTLIGKPGELLFRVHSPDMAVELSRLESQRDGMRLDYKMALTDGDRSAQRRTNIQLATVDEKIVALKRRIGRLEVMVPEGLWKVDGPPPVNIDGRFYNAGETVVTLIPARYRDVTVILEQSDLSLVKEGQKARVRLAGFPHRIYDAYVHRVTPVAKTDGPHRLFQVRIRMNTPEGEQAPALDLTGEVKIFGEERPFWEHILRPIRRIFRMDLWI